MWLEIYRLYNHFAEDEEVIASPEVAEMFYAICNKLKNSGNFIGYTYDLASEAFELVIKKFKGRKFKFWMHHKERVPLTHIDPHDPKKTKKYYLAPVYERKGKKHDEPVILKIPKEGDIYEETHEMKPMLLIEPDRQPTEEELEKHRWVKELPRGAKPQMVPSNFFGYVTTMAYRSFQSTIVRESKYRDGLESYRDIVYARFESDNSEMRPHTEEEEEEFFDESKDPGVYSNV